MSLRSCSSYQRIFRATPSPVFAFLVQDSVERRQVYEGETDVSLLDGVTRGGEVGFFVGAPVGTVEWHVVLAQVVEDGWAAAVDSAGLEYVAFFGVVELREVFEGHVVDLEVTGDAVDAFSDICSCSCGRGRGG